MQLDDWITHARDKGASDLHLEPRLPVTVRVRGELGGIGPAPTAPVLLESAKALLGRNGWSAFLERGSADVSRTIAGVRCRINVMRGARGVGFAIRLLPSDEPTLTELNLHPELGNLVRAEHGLVIVSGATGCGKSSTIAALVTAINVREARHIVTIEEPIEYAFRSRRAMIRQRQVGRDTPSFAQGLRDALREDPDVLMVGEMRDPETMRLTLDAAETGHLVLTTVHSSDTGDALQRVVSAFPAEVRPGVQAQLADALRGVVCQNLRFRPSPGIRVPECEILLATHAVKNLIRNGDFHKLRVALETGAGDGMWTRERYRRWLDGRSDWYVPPPPTAERRNGTALAAVVEEEEEDAARIDPVETSTATPDPAMDDDGTIVLEPPQETIQDILSELDRN